MVGELKNIGGVTWRSCFPADQLCVTNTRYISTEGVAVDIKRWTNVEDKEAAVDVCHTNKTWDIMTCVDFATHAIKRLMKGTNGHWSPVRLQK